MSAAAANATPAPPAPQEEFASHEGASPGEALPRRLSAEHRRSQILDTAARLFIERGFESVTMATIASELGISRPTIYSYFASTEEMLEALLNERMKGLPERIQPFLPAQEGEFTAFDALFLALLEERDLLMLLNSGGGPLFRGKRRAFMQTLQGRLQLHLLPRSKKAGEHSSRIIFLLLNLLSSVAYAQITEEPFEPSDLAGSLSRFAAGGVRAVLEE